MNALRRNAVRIRVHSPQKRPRLHLREPQLFHQHVIGHLEEVAQSPHSLLMQRRAERPRRLTAADEKTASENPPRLLLGPTSEQRFMLNATPLRRYFKRHLPIVDVLPFCHPALQWLSALLVAGV